MKKMLDIAINGKLPLPLDFLTERIAFLARTGAGKSGGMRVIAEEMLDAGQFIIFLDPKGDAWGLRSDFPVLILGGEHGDVPLEATAGKFVADFLVNQRISTVLDVSEFSEADMVRFVGDFADRFYRTNKDAVHLFLDEADEFAPQSGYNQAALKCLGAIQRIQRRGRGKGIGVTLATQRSAVINKSVLTQAGTLIAMQTTAPHDLKAVDAWLEYAATKEARREIMEALPRLKPREAYVYSPQYLGMEPRRITFKAFKSFDSMRTPRHGEARAKPKKLTEIDLSSIRSEMAATLETSKQNDPGELKKRIADLERALKAVPPTKKDDEAIRKAVAENDRVWESVVKDLYKQYQLVCQKFNVIYLTCLEVKAPKEFELPIKTRSKTDSSVSPAKPTIIEKQPSSLPKSDLSQAHGRILRALYWLQGEEKTQAKVAFYSGYTQSGHFTNTLGNLRSRGLVKGFDLTDAGVSALPSNIEPKPRGSQLREWLRPKLDVAANRILDALIEANGKRLTQSELAKAAGYNESGHFTNVLGKLRTLQMADGYAKDGGVKAADVFFE